MQQPLQISEDDHADLVAYLDGELTGEAARVLETRLNVEPGLRAEADSLKRAWDLLDYLPRTEPAPHFTERTLSKLTSASSGKKPSLGGDRWLVYPAVSLIWAALLLLMLGVGYWGYGRLRPREPGEQDLVRDLRLIENKHAYENIDDFEFLRQLDQPDLFGEEGGGS